MDSKIKKYIIACAGAGKTTLLIDEAIKRFENETVLITTFTNANDQSIKNKLIKKLGYIPQNTFISYCNKSLQLIEKCLEMNNFDKQVKILKSKVAKDLGISYLKLDDIDSAIANFNIVFSLDSFHDKCIVVRELYKFYTKKGKNPRDNITSWIDLLSKSCTKPQENEEYEKLNRYINQSFSKMVGKIRFINMNKKYGVIDFNTDSCTFFLRNAKFYVDYLNKDSFQGKTVRFDLQMLNGKTIAKNVELN